VRRRADGGQRQRIHVVLDWPSLFEVTRDEGAVARKG